jgi:hypothetical protein
MCLPSVHTVVAPRGHHPFPRMLSPPNSAIGEITQTFIWAFCSIFFFLQHSCYAFVAVTCFHQNLTLKQKPTQKACVWHITRWICFIHVFNLQLQLDPAKFFVLFLLASGSWKEYVPDLPLLSRAIERGNLWVMIMGWAPLRSVSIRLLWSQLHTTCSHPLMQSLW